MKTTVEISDGLLRQVKKQAEREGVTLRTLIERGLHRVITERKGRPAFKLRRVKFGGQGLQPEFRGASWEKLIDASYQGRGG
ncbi:MAG: hypothetical protein SFV21_13135 [Rhodospirillaceae bacterium]|nr:hypothetical protein [Rhodospirillaceae bacterium]